MKAASKPSTSTSTGTGTTFEYTCFTLIEKIQSNIAVHGLFWAAEHYKKVARLEAIQKGKAASNFDTFYFAVFGKWPTR